MMADVKISQVSMTLLNPYIFPDEFVKMQFFFSLSRALWYALSEKLRSLLCLGVCQGQKFYQNAKIFSFLERNVVIWHQMES